jgi:hypothetical protein
MKIILMNLMIPLALGLVTHACPEDKHRYWSFAPIDLLIGKIIILFI